MAPPTHIHVFALPQDLIDTLTPRNLVSQPHSSPRATSPDFAPSQSTTGARTCNICLGAAFADVNDQRAHYRSDWHRYNVKIRLKGGTAASEAEFAKLVDSLEDSISGSASSSGEDSDESDAINSLLHKTKIASRSRSPSPSERVAPQTALTWFHSPPSTQIGVYRALFPTASPNTAYLDHLKAMQRSGGPDGRKWAMFMVAGGHFAGLVVRVSPPEAETDDTDGVKKKKPKRPRPNTEVLKHKTFHRYTTRRKQGGSQSVNDNAKGPAKSAGAQLRRYGEQALRDDIRNLLLDWADEIDQCERIWIRASVSNRRIFLDYDGAVINKGDERLRTFPFPTRRPTQSELARCLLELTRVKASHFTEEALRAQDEAYLASLPKPKPKPQPSSQPPEKEKEKVPVLSKEEVILRDKWMRLLDMVNHGRLDALTTFWEREGETLGGINARIPEWTGERYSTLLQVAAHTDQEDVTRWLLDEAHADPTIEVSGAEDGVRRTAYDVASSRNVRDVFRRSAGAHPDQWDWLGAARVPSVLNQTMEEERDEKKKVRRKGLRDKLREREKERVHAEPEEEESLAPPPEPVKEIGNAPRKLGGGSRAAEGLTGLTPEMRAKVERERRARAAEARMKALAER
ncbi:hypothetical protein OF83DRAFT_1140946 [Amylostereum chailletii]|nr:hypothetical protein OF83DRAFT_1140946 [Amylostereum chailletii]